MIDFVTDTQSASAYSVERDLLSRLLALGHQLLCLFFAVCVHASRRAFVVTKQGDRLPFHSDRPRCYVSIFGRLTLARPYYYAPGCGAWFPLDAEVGLPADRYSDLVREISDALAVEMPYHTTASLLERFFGLRLSSRVVAEIVCSDAVDGEAFYDRRRSSRHLFWCFRPMVKAYP